MNAEEIKKKLAEAGINIGGWQNQGERKVKSPLIEKQKESLAKLEGLLQQQIEQDKQKLGELHANLTRLKHGGSR